MTRTMTRRGTRGRVMLVGSHASFNDLEANLHQETLRASTMYDAIGQLSDSPGTLPISAVVIADSVLASSTTGAADALRRIDPAVQLIMVGQRHGVPTDGFDASFADDAAVDDVVTMLSATLLDDATPRPREPQRPSAATPRETPAPTEPPVIDDTDDAIAFDEGHTSVESDIDQHPPAMDPPMRTLEAPAPPPPPPARPQTPPRDDRVSRGEALGDIDLVECLLTGHAPLPMLALRLIEEQAGFSDATLTDVDNPPPDIEAPDLCPIERDGATFGWLRVPDVDRTTIEPWADWLAHWMALDESFRQYRDMAYSDDLTSAFNRRYFEAFMEVALPKARERRRPVTVMVFDLDNFKQYNDAFGHEAGDLVLTETVRLLTSVIRAGDRVCRIGGDEFAVVFADLDGPREVGSTHPETVEDIARRFQDQIAQMWFPALGVDAPGSLSISAGLATFPWDGTDGDSLLRLADQRALESKRKGKNVITFGGPGRDR